MHLKPRIIEQRTNNTRNMHKKKPPKGGFFYAEVILYYSTMIFFTAEPFLRIYTPFSSCGIDSALPP